MIIITAAVFLILTGAVISACGSDSGGSDADVSPPPEDTPKPTPPPSTPEPTLKPVVLVPYDGVVEHLFFNEIISYPELAFSGRTGQKSFDDNHVTAHEFSEILKSLHKNNYVLIDLNDVWSVYTNDNGQQRMHANTMMIPEGKKPLVISFDDLSFYGYMLGNGFMERYIIGSDGDIWAEGTSPSGNHVTTQDFSAITLLDKFVRENPDFSHNGTKGCIALTGYDGILGYRTQSNDEDSSESFRLYRMQEIARARAVVARLKETGWYFATHSYAHVRASTMSASRIEADALRWLDEVGSIVGETQIYAFQFGERLDGCDWRCTKACGPSFRMYVDLGFHLFAAVGSGPYTLIKSDIAAVTMDRMAVDGLALRSQAGRDRLIRFFDAKDVFDHTRPTEYGVTWDQE